MSEESVDRRAVTGIHPWVSVYGIMSPTPADDDYTEKTWRRPEGMADVLSEPVLC